MIKEIVSQTLQELENSKKAPYPLYYKEVFNQIAKEKNLQIDNRLLMESYKDINEELLHNTQQTTEFIAETNHEIKNNSKNLIEEVEVKNIHGDVLSLIREFETNLVNKLEESNSKIASLQKELESVYKQINIDSLTKAYSRKAYENDIKSIVKAGQNRQLNAALVVVDLDHFKEINDTYGHLIGDFVLVKLIRLIKEIIRKEDKIYRFGGDEFILFFNRIDKQSIEKIVEKIRKKIESTKLKYKDYIINLTVSVGVACHIQNDTENSWLGRADKALYDSKKFRNKVTILC